METKDFNSGGTNRISRQSRILALNLKLSQTGCISLVT